VGALGKPCIIIVPKNTTGKMCLNVCTTLAIFPVPQTQGSACVGIPSTGDIGPRYNSVFYSNAGSHLKTHAHTHATRISSGSAIDAVPSSLGNVPALTPHDVCGTVFQTHGYKIRLCPLFVKPYGSHIHQ
jgi:hypothetical protein